MPSARNMSAIRYCILSICLLAVFFSAAPCPAAETEPPAQAKSVDQVKPATEVKPPAQAKPVDQAKPATEVKAAAEAEPAAEAEKDQKGHLERGIALYQEDKYDQARVIWEAGEKAGDLDCTMMLGTYIHSPGRGAPQSDQKAFAQYMQAAKKNHAEGMSVVGSCYLYGIGVAKDTPKGIEWLTKAANAGFTTASAELGDLYADSGSMKPNLKLAAKWHLKAAEEGHPQSQLYMGKAYMTGEGVQMDSAAAKEWLQKALDGGEDSAKALLEKLQ